MASTLVRLCDQLLVEYFYKETSYQVGDTELWKVNNSYDNSITILNKKITNNYSKYTVVNTDKANVMLDENGSYHYYDADVNITYKKADLNDFVLFKYNKVRVHIMSGYNFDDCNGFNINFYIEGENKKLINLANYVYLKSSTSQIIFAPRPIKISESIFDKYVEFEIMSLENMISMQDSTPKDLFKITDGKILQNHKLYIEWNQINTINYNTGFLQYTVLNSNRTVISSTNRYNKIESHIALSEDGSYFEYQARYDGRPIEDFMYELNSMSGNRYYLVHQITVVEQVGMAFYTCDEFTIVQKEDYEKVYKFRPVLYNQNVQSVSIDYSLKLINEVDGTGITKTGSVSTRNVTAFRNKLISLNIPIGQIKTYNKISAPNQLQVKDNLFTLNKTKVVSTYVTNNTIGVQNTAPLKIYPFRNNIEITVTNNGNVDKDLLSVDLVYYLVFIKNDSSKIYIKEVSSEMVSKENGELIFVIEEAQSMDIRSCNDKGCYLLAKSSSSESVVTKLTWEKA